MDLANGDYDVIVTLGDTAQAHDLMGVFLEGAQVDTVTTTAGQPVARTYRVTIGDGQLNLRLFDLGGSGPWVMINALDVLAAPDEAGPRVESVDVVGKVPAPVDRIRFRFSETIDSSSFTIADVVSIEGPSGAIAPVAVQSVSVDNSEFEVVFAPQTTPGVYRLVIGPHIADLAGNAMDQDEDGSVGRESRRSVRDYVYDYGGSRDCGPVRFWHHGIAGRGRIYTPSGKSSLQRGRRLRLAGRTGVCT